MKYDMILGPQALANPSPGAPIAADRRKDEAGRLPGAAPMRMTPMMRRNAGRFLIFLVGPYALFVCSMALSAAANIGLALLMSAAFVFALPHMFFDGTVGVLIGVAINIAIAAAVIFVSQKRTLTGAIGIYIVCVALVAVALHGMRAVLGDPWGLFPRGGGI